MPAIGATMKTIDWTATISSKAMAITSAMPIPTQPAKIAPLSISFR